jgi:hypothetical protein
LPSTKLGIVGLLSFHTIHEIHWAMEKQW